MIHMMWGHHGGHAFPFLGGGLMLGLMLLWLIPFLIIAYLVYRDAERRGTNGLLWGVLVLIPVLGLLFLILYLVQRETAEQATAPAARTPMEILKERYARGEITSEQFEKISEDLKR